LPSHTPNTKSSNVASFARSGVSGVGKTRRSTQPNALLAPIEAWFPQLSWHLGRKALASDRPSW